MQHAIHWDYADSFTGRDAAYLIAGFDPSSNSAEDAYRVQPIVHKLKEAYYLACEELRCDLDHEYHETIEGHASGGLHHHQYKKSELLSVHMEDMIKNFMSSTFVANGHFMELEGLDRGNFNFDPKHKFPEEDAYAALKKETDSGARALRNHWQELSPEIFSELSAISKRLADEEEKERNHEITLNQYFAIKKELESQQENLRAVLNERSRADDPSLHESIEKANEKYWSISAQRDDWHDLKSGEYLAKTEEYEPLHQAAYSESYQWLSTYIHEFDSQRFSRSELCRWLSDNNYPTAYSFASKEPADEKPLSSKERTNYLNLIGSLADLYWKAAYPGEEYKQVTLLADLEKYDFSGMGERNLKEKLSLAMKAIKS